MKFSTTLALAVAPLSMAARLRSAKRDAGLNDRGLLFGGGDKGGHEAGHDGGLGGFLEQMKGHGLTAHSKTEVIIIWANPGAGAETTKINEKVTVTETVVAGGGAETPPPAAGTEVAPPAGASHTVKVGGPAGLVFEPDQLNDVPIGDTVVFEFLAENHTVTQSPFDTPCDAMEGGMDSGFMPNPDNSVSPPPQVAMQVMVDTPLWFYCKQGNHCGKGMVFSINPTEEKTQAMFQQMAIAQNGEGEATPITGGDDAAASPPPEAPAEPPAETPAEPPAEWPAETPAEPPAAPPVETPEAPPADGGVVESPAAGGGAEGATPGQGTVLPDGSCSCVVACAAGSFPALDSQGVGSFGGVGGALPMAAMR